MGMSLRLRHSTVNRVWLMLPRPERATISSDEAAEMVVEAIIKRPHEVSTRVGKFGELVHAVAPGMHHLIMSGAFHMLPDSDRRKEAGDGERAEQPVTPEAYALGMLMRGIHL